MADAATGSASDFYVQFYEHDLDGGYSAYRHAETNGFVLMNFVRPSDRQRALTFYVPHWFVEDCLQDGQGKHWYRDWYGVMDDFGNLVEIDSDALAATNWADEGWAIPF